ncbi:sn-glycerol-3-phosphate ABC transporter substrate-binding protein UgpB [Arsenicitalea aurantiaca]|uniref:sn-glycerol-3-phosphate-binding periplasmic protein UgpB n=1 Tax=Arsenicitalea aurantiaca TaxID=1783274 RepID=A0A433XAP1_9HYPH|nr:sn-glycerol-3-phosphate ABC transporter substrate-binding protein UgpB [Arsenicitalea aurantiaca]RUT31100.1 sn-glycerol-3-phosphate ABC transporter substrate-binding protein UgpB [Arsenicitalea aurantiaca]
MSVRHVAGLAALATSLFASTAYAQTEIAWWHAMGGELGAKLEAVAEGFNQTQDDYRIVPVYRGTYGETLTAAIAAFRASEQPAIVQVYEVGTGTMMAAQGAVYPVYQLMADNDQPFEPSEYLASVVGYYSDTSGNILSLPFNSSTPIMYYNKEIFEAAGLDPETPPATWAGMEAAMNQIVESGAAPCGMTTAWISWIHTENFSALHNLSYGTLENGFGGLGAEFAMNNEHLARHWDNLAHWEDEGVFRYGGPEGGPDAQPAFLSGECGLFMNSSAGRAAVVANADFEVGFAPLPYYDDVVETPMNSIIGGATLWVMQGRPAEEYEGVAAFFSYLSQPEVQADWHQDTGYLPITNAAYDLGQEQGYYEANPGSDTSIMQMTRVEPNENSKGLRFGSYTQVRALIDEEFEAVLASDKTGQEALDSLVERGNQLLREFEAANS